MADQNDGTHRASRVRRPGEPESKRCKTCQVTKPIEAFYTKGKYRATHCAPCMAGVMQGYRDTIGEHLKAKDRERYAADSRRKKASKRAYWQRNRPSITASAREKYAERYAKDPAPWRAANARRRMLLSQKMSREDRQVSVDYRRAIRNDSCGYCGSRTPGDMHDDHYFPLAKGGTDHWWNLLRACGPCNRRKHTACGTAFRLAGGWNVPAPGRLPPESQAS